MERGSSLGTFVSEYKIYKLTFLILGHVNHEEYNFDVSFSNCICEKDIVQPCEGFVVQAECFFFVRNVFYVWGDLSFVLLKSDS